MRECDIGFLHQGETVIFFFLLFFSFCLSFSTVTSHCVIHPSNNVTLSTTLSYLHLRFHSCLHPPSPLPLFFFSLSLATTSLNLFVPVAVSISLRSTPDCILPPLLFYSLIGCQFNTPIVLHTHTHAPNHTCCPLALFL